MFRLWGKEFKDNHMLRDTVICDETDETRTHKIFNALDSICYEFDLSKAIWLDHNIDEFKRHDKTRFYQDNFVDSIEKSVQLYNAIHEYDAAGYSKRAIAQIVRCGRNTVTKYLNGDYESLCRKNLRSGME